MDCRCGGIGKAGSKCGDCGRKLIAADRGVKGASLVGGDGEPKMEKSIKSKDSKASKKEGHKGANKQK